MNATTLLSDLTAAGMTQQAIAAELRTSQGYINDLLSGRRKDPKHSLMVALLDLHARRRSAVSQ